MRQLLFLSAAMLLGCLSTDLAAYERVEHTVIETDSGPGQPAARPSMCDGDIDCALKTTEAARNEVTEAGPPLTAPPDIIEAVQRASNFIGVDFEYLLRVAALESSYNGATEAETSTAVGLFQFIERTWLFMVRDMAHEFGMDELAAAIILTEDGNYEIPDPVERERILKLRYDAGLSAIIAAEFTRRNAEYGARELGRELKPGELYVTHFLGPNAGLRLIRLLDSEPASRASKHFPQAAKANRTIFFRDRKPRTVAEVYRLLVDKYRGCQLYAEGVAESAEATATD